MRLRHRVPRLERVDELVPGGGRVLERRPHLARRVPLLQRDFSLCASFRLKPSLRTCSTRYGVAPSRISLAVKPASLRPRVSPASWTSATSKPRSFASFGVFAPARSSWTAFGRPSAWARASMRRARRCAAPLISSTMSVCTGAEARPRQPRVAPYRRRVVKVHRGLERRLVEQPAPQHVGGHVCALDVCAVSDATSCWCAAAFSSSSARRRSTSPRSAATSRSSAGERLELGRLLLLSLLRRSFNTLLSVGVGDEPRVVLVEALEEGGELGLRGLVPHLCQRRLELRLRHLVVAVRVPVAELRHHVRVALGNLLIDAHDDRVEARE